MVTEVEQGVDTPLDAVVSAVDALTAGELWRCDDAVVIGRLERLPVLIERLRGTHMQVIGEITRRGVVEREQGWSVADRLADRLRQSLRASRAATLLAKDLGSVDGLLDAICDGRVCVAQAKAIREVMVELPDQATPEQRDQLERALVELCERYEAKTIRQLGNELIERLFPEQVDAKLAERLEAEERRAKRRRYLGFGTPYDGTMSLHGVLPTAEALRFKQLTDA